MGCSPFGKLMSMAFGGKGRRHRRRSRQGRRQEYSLPPPPHLTSQSMARTVIYRDDSPIVVAHPEHTIQNPAQVQVPDNQQLHHQRSHPLPEATDILPSNHAHAAAGYEVGAEEVGYAVRGDVCHQPEFLEPAGVAAAAYRYAPSPDPSAVWGEHGEPRREYFGGEYRYCYPTPVREGIYSIATDANRLTTMFSDENPNACSIV